ncbi:MAG: enoyl-CoA hydratase/isomerase family protein [Betaproteobacteria bacterium]|nr:enoyl-CoA hydratase/isomerase family protein [Betaproteobacteria bacterium]
MGALDFQIPLSQPNISDRVTAELDRGGSNVLWITMKRPSDGGCQNFSLSLLHGLRDVLHAIKGRAGRWVDEGQLLPVQYAVLKSGHPDYFGLGGDLRHFHACIERKDKDALYQYSRLCLDIMYEWATCLNNQATTIALVQGRALGGGFEAALSADYLIAEEQSEFGFPEILFGLFPCTGGMSLLARRVGVYEAERMMTDARIYSAAELKEKGIVDEICPRGEGALAVERFIANHSKHRNARLMLQRGRYRVAPLDYSELLTVVGEWVEAAMDLGEADLKVMDMLIRLQRDYQPLATR